MDLAANDGKDSSIYLGNLISARIFTTKEQGYLEAD